MTDSSNQHKKGFLIMIEKMGFQQAKIVWAEQIKSQYSQHVGFWTTFTLLEEKEITITLAANTFYRLYINGKMWAHGPARAGKDYSRLDILKKRVSGKVYIAIEVLAIQKTEHYSNECTLEPGFLQIEISDGEQIITATGDKYWKCKELTYRHMVAELMSHCRGITEYYEIDEESQKWKVEAPEDGKMPMVLDMQRSYLPRRVPYATLRKIPLGQFLGVHDVCPREARHGQFILGLTRAVNRRWYTKVLKEEDCFIDAVYQEGEKSFTGKLKRSYDKEKREIIEVQTGQEDATMTFSMPQSEVGFLCLKIQVEEDTVLDLINTDQLDCEGVVGANSYMARFCLKKGAYDICTFEPRLIKFVKLILRTRGRVVFSIPEVVEFTYPEERSNFFVCSDGELNFIYEAAKRTLRLNMQDVFMDCPQRERGAWLCDANFMAQGAWQMFGDLSVEKDFLENFLLTDKEQYESGFFPEVYPGCKENDSDCGIKSWSFWLCMQLYDYVKRSGDREFAMKYQVRIAYFMNQLKGYIGESGLFEGLSDLFVDWSLSNRPFTLGPISVPTNCLIVCAYERMAELYQIEEWREIAEKVRKRISEIDYGIGGASDAVAYENGKWISQDCLTESGIALQLYSGFHREDKKYIRNFVETMGYASKKRSNPMIGKANQCMGLIIRFCVLGQLNRVGELIAELKDLYMSQLLQGPGTMFENYNGKTGCHGFNGVVGGLLMSHVLGLAQPCQDDKTIVIRPGMNGIVWAKGMENCEDGMISLDWHADYEEHILYMNLVLPDTWKAQYEFPFELMAWKIFVNGKEIEV